MVCALFTPTPSLFLSWPASSFLPASILPTVDACEGGATVEGHLRRQFEKPWLGKGPHLNLILLSTIPACTHAHRPRHRPSLMPMTEGPGKPPRRWKKNTYSTRRRTKQKKVDEQFYAVRAILDEKHEKGKVWYKIDWAPDPNTGEEFDPSWVRLHSTPSFPQSSVSLSSDMVTNRLLSRNLRETQPRT